MFICKLSNGKEKQIREWYVGPDNCYLKFIDTTYDEMEQFIPENDIITSISIIDDQNLVGPADNQTPYSENYSVYVDRKSILIQTENLNIMSTGEDGETVINSVDKKVYTVTLGIPYTDARVTALQNYVGYVENPELLSLENYKLYAIENSKNDLKKYLLSNPLSSNCHGNVEKLYNISEEKQTLLMKEISLVTMAAQTNTPYQASWNASGESCTYDWTLEELTQLSFEMAVVVKPLVSYQQSIEEEISSKTSKEEIKAIIIDYASHDPRNKVE